MMNTHIEFYSKSEANVKANGKSCSSPVSVQIQIQIQVQINPKSASVNALKTYYTLQRDSALLDPFGFVIVFFVSFLELKVRQFCYKH